MGIEKNRRVKLAILEWHPLPKTTNKNENSNKRPVLEANIEGGGQKPF